MDSKERSTAQKVFDGLESSGIAVTVETLPVGDYVVSENCGIERKSVYDFLGTLLHRQLFEKAFQLKDSYPNAIIILEGYLPSIYKYSKVHPSVIAGAMFSLSKCGISIVPTINWRETVTFLVTAVRQEQGTSEHYLKVHSLKNYETIVDQQVFFLSSLPKIGRERATAILKAYKSPLTALNDFLNWKKIEGIGEKIVEKVKVVLESTYQ